MTESDKLNARRLAVTPKGLGMVTPFNVASGKGALLYDLDGRSIIDFACGIGVTTSGHCPESVVKAITQQASQLVHACFTVAGYEAYVALAEDLAALLPHGEATKVMLTCTGAESVENAIKIARQATRRSGVICYTGAFHGRSLMGLSLTSKVSYKHHCGPFAGEVYRLAYPDYYHSGEGLSEEQFVERELRRLRDAFMTMIPADEVAAIIIEPILGEGGFVPAPLAYLKGLRAICDQHGIMLILDEVQTGFCRTGKWGYYQYADITPDLSTWAKALGSGIPIGAVLGRAEIMDAATPGTLGGTFPGNPIGCAAARATLQFMRDSNLNARSIAIGQQIRSCLMELKATYPAIGDVRGQGAMMALEFVVNGDPNAPFAECCSAVLEACWANGLLVIPAGTYKNIIRILVPLIIDDATLARGLDILKQAVHHACSPSFDKELLCDSP